MTDANSERAPAQSEVYALERPESSLLTYYGLSSMMLGPFFFIFLIPKYFRYRTMRYRFDDEGVSMRWGVLFRREINLTYARIQDIHLVSNVVERWLGLARIKIQTASGSSKAEMTIEGVAEFEALRDFLYARMRGTQGGAGATHGSAGRVPIGGGTAIEHAGAASAGPVTGATSSELTATLRAVAEELSQLRHTLEARGAGAPSRRPGGRDGEGNA